MARGFYDLKRYKEAAAVAVVAGINKH